MATAARRHLHSLIHDLEVDAPGFDFFQAVRLLEAAGPSKTPAPERPNAALRLRAAAELSFPAADLRRAHRNEQGELVLEANFFGLYGVDAPLPAYFGNTVAADDDAGRCVRTFLDLFGGRFYELLYLAWKKPRAHLLDSGDNLLEAYLLALSGASRATRRDLALTFAGGLGSRAKGSGVLVGILQECLDVPAHIEAFVPCWVAVGPVSVLGCRGMTLGDDLVLGEQVLDVSRKINIVLGPMKQEQALDLLPGNPVGADLNDLLKSYLPPTLEFDLILHVVSSSLAQVLGQDPLYLGWTLCLGEPGSGMRRVRLPGSSYQK